jgi:hypothetical protein
MFSPTIGIPGHPARAQARRLQKVAATHASEVKRRLKRCEGLLDEVLEGRDDASDKKKAAAETAAVALQLEAELRDWPALNRKNLHPFRLKLKEFDMSSRWGRRPGTSL